MSLYSLFMLLAMVLANLPCLISNRFFLLFNIVTKKWYLVLVEFLAYYCILGLTANYIEYRQAGDIHPQDWEFYVITLVLFVIFAAPSYLYKYVYKHR